VIQQFKMFSCAINNCGKSFTRKYDLKRHQTRFHLTNADERVEKCFLCGQIFGTIPELEHHYEKSHRPSRRFYLRQSAFNKGFTTFRYNFLWDDNNFDESQNRIKSKIIRQILAATLRNMIAKVSLIFIAEMMMVDHQGEKVTKAIVPFRAGSFLANAASPQAIEKNVRNSFLKQKMELDEFMKGGSNWQFVRGLAFDIEVAAIKPLRGGANVDISGFLNKSHLYNPKAKKINAFSSALLIFCYFLGRLEK